MPRHERHADPEDRVLIFAPIGRDAELTCRLLEGASIRCAVCQSLGSLTETLEADGAGALLLTEEALAEPGF